MLDSFTIELKVSPQTLVDSLSKKTDDYRQDLFDIFTFNKKEYKGFITAQEFKIKKCQSFIVSFEHFAEAFGKIEAEQGKLKISTEIYSIMPYSTLISFGLIALFFTSIGLIAIASFLVTGKIDGLYAGIALLTFETIFLGLPILAMRWSVKTLSWDLEQELRRIRE